MNKAQSYINGLIDKNYAKILNHDKNIRIETLKKINDCHVHTCSLYCDMMRNFNILIKYNDETEIKNNLEHIKIEFLIGDYIIFNYNLFDNLLLCLTINKTIKTENGYIIIPIFIFKKQNFLNLFNNFNNIGICVQFNNIEINELKIKYTTILLKEKIRKFFRNIYKTINLNLNENMVLYQNFINLRKENINQSIPIVYNIKRDLRFLFLRIKNIKNFKIKLSGCCYEKIYNSSEIKFCKNIYVIDLYKINNVFSLVNTLQWHVILNDKNKNEYEQNLFDILAQKIRKIKYNKKYKNYEEEIELDNNIMKSVIKNNKYFDLTFGYLLYDDINKLLNKNLDFDYIKNHQFRSPLNINIICDNCKYDRNDVEIIIPCLNKLIFAYYNIYVKYALLNNI